MTEPNESQATAPSRPIRAGVPVRRGLIRRTLKWGEHLCAGGFLVGLLVFLSPLPGMIYRSFGRGGELRHADYVICLGGNMERVVEAARLVKDGVGDRLIVSNHGEAARLMREIAVEWGAPADRILVDDESFRTTDHPAGARRLRVDPEKDTCIIVTDYTHLARSEAVFRRAGFRHVIMREPRWDRQNRERMPPGGGLVWRFMEMPGIVYESAAWARYWLSGDV